MLRGKEPDACQVRVLSKIVFLFRFFFLDNSTDRTELRREPDGSSEPEKEESASSVQGTPVSLEEVHEEEEERLQDLVQDKQDSLEGSSSFWTTDESQRSATTPTNAETDDIETQATTPTATLSTVDLNRTGAGEQSSPETSPGTVALEQALTSLQHLSLARPKLNPFTPISLSPFPSPHFQRSPLLNPQPQQPNPVLSKRTGQILPKPRPIPIPSLPPAAGEWLSPSSTQPRYTSSPHPEPYNSLEALPSSPLPLLASTPTNKEPTKVSSLCSTPAPFGPSSIVPLPSDPLTPSRAAYNPGVTVPRRLTPSKSFTLQSFPRAKSPPISVEPIYATKSSQTSVKDLAPAPSLPRPQELPLVPQEVPSPPASTPSPSKYTRRPYLSPPTSILSSPPTETGQNGNGELELTP